MLIRLKYPCPKSVEEIGQENGNTNLAVYDVEQKEMVNKIPIEEDKYLYILWEEY
jgi:hypothetical protein